MSNSEIDKLREENERLRRKIENNEILSKYSKNKTPNKYDIPIIDKRTNNNSSNCSVAPIVIALVNMILSLIGFTTIIIILIILPSINDPEVSEFEMQINFLSLMYAFYSIITGCIFYPLFRRIRNDNKKHITLCVFGIIFGGLLIIIASIICLCDHTRNKH